MNIVGPGIFIKFSGFTRQMSIKCQSPEAAPMRFRQNCHFQLHMLPFLFRPDSHALALHTKGPPDGGFIRFAGEKDFEKALHHFMRCSARESIQDFSIFVKVDITVVDCFEDGTHRNLTPHVTLNGFDLKEKQCESDDDDDKQVQRV